MKLVEKATPRWLVIELYVRGVQFLAVYRFLERITVVMNDPAHHVLYDVQEKRSQELGSRLSTVEKEQIRCET